MGLKNEEQIIQEEIKKLKKKIYDYIQLVKVLLSLKLHFERKYKAKAYVEPSVWYKEDKEKRIPDLLILTSDNTAIVFDHKIIESSDERTVRSRLRRLKKYYGTIIWKEKEYTVNYAILLCSKETWQNILNAGLIEKPMTWVYKLVEDEKLYYEINIFSPKSIKIKDSLLSRIISTYKKHGVIKVERPYEATKYVFIRQKPPIEYVAERVYRFLYSRMDPNVDEEAFQLKNIINEFNWYYSPWVLAEGEAKQLTIGRLNEALKLLDEIGLAKYKPEEGVVIVKKIKKLSGELLDHILEKIVKHRLKAEAKRQTKITNFFH